MPLPIVIKGENKYKVKKIFNSQIYREKLQYLIKWLGYFHDKDQWIGCRLVEADKNVS